MIATTVTKLVARECDYLSRERDLDEYGGYYDPFGAHTSTTHFPADDLRVTAIGTARTARRLPPPPG
jgi:hypothetical protein